MLLPWVNWKSVETRLQKYSRPAGDCIVWTMAVNRGGYGRIFLGIGPDGKQKNALAHRAAFFLATGKDPARLCVCHRCDNRRCINPKHLFLGTYEDNNRDMFAKGRGHVWDGTQALGVKNVNAKLTPEAIEHIRGSLTAKLSDLAALYGVTKQAIWHVRHGLTWTRSVASGPAQKPAQPTGAE